MEIKRPKNANENDENHDAPSRQGIFARMKEKTAKALAVVAATALVSCTGANFEGFPQDSGSCEADCQDAGQDAGVEDGGRDGGPTGDGGHDGGPVDSGVDAGGDGGSDGGVVPCPGVFNATRTGAWNVGVDVPLGGYNIRYTGPSGADAAYEVRCQANGNPVRLGLAIATFTPTDVNVPEDSKKVQFNLTGGSATVMNGTINTANYP
ncbi:MAG: hypothetical protein U0R44_05795 [Candidatus Micrarchaeia archaeon]